MKRISTKIITILIVLIAGNVYAQRGTKASISYVDTIYLDLATNISPTYQVPNKKPVVIVIHNLLPSGHYAINQTRSLKLSGPLSLPAAVAATTGIDPCTGLEQALHDAKTEAEFGQLMTICRTNGCDFYEKYLTASTSDPISVSKLNNEVFTLTITNLDTKRDWTVNIQTEDRGQFVTVYGFTYIPFVFGKPHTYYAQQNLDSKGAPLGTYTVAPGSSESVAEYAPTVAFHYITKSSGTLSSSFTAGLGVSLSSNATGISPVVLAGYSLLYNQNIGINFGVAAHQVTNLKGEFNNGQLLYSGLQANDLNEQVTRFNPFFSIIFRFGSNPFSAKKLPAASSGVISTGTISAPASTGALKK